MNITKQTAVMPSMMVVSENLRNLIDVNSRKQKPRKLDAEFNICGALLLSFIAK
jgi:hypothetical protein